MGESFPACDPESLIRHADGVRRLARHLVADAATADDAVQEALVTALVRGPRRGGSLGAWLSGVVRNKVREARRAEARRRRHEARAPAPERAPAPDEVASLVEENRRLSEALQRLPEPYRTVVWLRWFEDLPPRSIALRLGVPEETVRTRLKRALERLRDLLARGHGDDRRWALALVPLAAAGRSAVGVHTLLLGGLMSAKAKLALGVVVLVLAGLATWRIAVAPGPVVPPSGETAAEPPDEAGPVLEGVPPSPAPPADDEESAPAGAWEAVVRTLDEEGVRLAGVEVRVGPWDGLDPSAHRVAGRTGEDGLLVLRLPPATAAARVVAFAVGRRPSVGHLYREGGRRADLRLAPARVLHLRVMDADTGQPIAGVACESLVGADGREWPDRATTDASGRASVLDPYETDFAWQVPIRLVKAGYEPRFRFERNALRRRGASSDRPLDVYLVPGEGLRLRVVDEDGRPVEGATVEAWSGSAGWPIWTPPPEVAGVPPRGVGEQAPLGEATTDPEGLVVLGVPAPDRPWVARARADARAGHALGSRRPRGGVHGEIVLHRTFDVAGRVVDESGGPLSGAWVRYAPLAPDGTTVVALSSSLEPATETSTDEGGGFRLLRVPIPREGLQVVANHGDRFGGALVGRPADEGGIAQVDIPLRTVDGDPLRVRVTGPDGFPVEGALVTIGNIVPFTPTDAEGRAVRVRPRGSEHPLRVVAAGFAPWQGDGPPEGDEAEVRLQPARAIEGRVLGPEGEPASAYVDVFEAGVAELPEEERSKRQVYGPGWLGRAEADPRGWFRVERLPPGTLFFRAWFSVREGTTWRSPQAEALVREGEEVVLRLPEAPRPAEGRGVSGAVFAGDGTRLTRYRVHLEREGRFVQPLERGWEFRFEGIEPAGWTLVASDEAGAQKGRASVTVPTDRDVEDVRVVLEASLSLGGRLVLPEGAAGADLARTPVLLSRDTASPEEPARALADAAGRFRFDRLEAGAYRLRLEARAGAAGAWQVLDGDVVVDRSGPSRTGFAVVAAGRLVLHLGDVRFTDTPQVAFEHRDEPEVRASWASRVRVRGPGGATFEEVGLYRGTHVRRWALLPGSWELEVRTPHGSFSTRLAVAGGEDAEVRVELRE